MGLKIQASNQRRSGGQLDQDINHGFNSTTLNYVVPIWTDLLLEGVSRIDLKVDEDCNVYNQPNDITQNALLHCDCRYLTVGSINKNETPIVNVWYSNQTQYNGSCTTDINDGRKPIQDSPLYLCWENQEGIFVMLWIMAGYGFYFSLLT